MKVMAAADIHGHHPFYRRLLEAAEQSKAEAIVLAGDLLGFPWAFKTVEEAQRADAKEVRSLLAASAVPVFYIMGNDDFVDLEPSSKQIQSLHSRRIDLGKYNLIGYQYSLPFIGGIYEKPEKSIAADLGKLASLADSQTVFVTHGPARGILDTTPLGTSAGSVSILNFVIRLNVRAHIHGHIHERFGREGRHFNVAALPLMRAMLIDIDRMNHQVVDLALKKT